MTLNSLFNTMLAAIFLWLSGNLLAQQWPVEIVRDNLTGAWIRPGDFDNDNDQDLLIQNGDTLFWYENLQPGWAEHLIDTEFLNSETAWVDVFDLDQDGDLDVLQHPFFHPGAIAWNENRMNGMQWVKHVINSAVNQPGSAPQSYGDIDGDNDIDLVVPSWGDGTILWFENLSGDTTWQEHLVVNIGSNAIWATLADMDGDNDLDVVGARYFSGDIVWYENLLRNTAWVAHPIATLPGTAIGISADMDEDGDLDIVTHSNISNVLIWYENPSWVSHTITSGVSGLVIGLGPLGDIDNDGDLDVTFGGQHKIGWCENLGNAANWNRSILDSLHDQSPIPMDISDINGDGYPDLTVGTLDWFTGVGDTRWYANPLNRTTLKRVPQQYPTIQAGIDAAADGDTVLVADSTYYEHINFMGKAITVASKFIVDGDTNHIANTIIDGSLISNPDRGSVVYFISGEDTNSVLCGFTITGGSGTYDPGVGERLGGGILCLSGATICHNRIINNTVQHGGFASGGGISCGGVFTANYIHIEHNIIRENSVEGTSVWGAGMWFGANGRIVGNTIEDNLLSASSGTTSGAGIGCQSPSENQRYQVRIADNSILRNLGETASTSSGSYGAGLDVFYTDLIVENNEISENTVSSAFAAFGPAFRLVFTQNAQITGNRISYNQGIGNNATNAGAILLVGTTFTNIYDNTIEGNSGTWGGAILDFQTENTVIQNNRMVDNTATLDGGAIDSNSPSIIRNNLMAGNTANRGGAINVLPFSQDKSGRLRATAILGSISGLQGNKIRNTKPLSTTSLVPLVMHNNTFANNVATSQGGAIFAAGGTEFIVLNSILYANTAPGGEQISAAGVTVTVEYSDIQGGWSGTGNIDRNPEFADTTNFYLVSGSICVDAGNPDPAYNDPESVNNPGFACWPALGGLRNDMGAYGGPGAICVDSVFVGIDNELPGSVPQVFLLLQNYPNPFNPSTTIEFALPQAAGVKLTIYNTLGQEVATLVNRRLNAGQHRFTWQANDQPSGVYFYRLRVDSPSTSSGRGGEVLTRKMLLLR